MGPESQARTDSWVQWGILILTIIAALWNLSGRLSAIEQQLRDDATFHDSESFRLQQLENRFDAYVIGKPLNNVGH